MAARRPDGRGEDDGAAMVMARRRPRWEQLTLDAPDAAGPVVAGDGRAWPTLDEALAQLEATGWRIAVATRQPAGVRYMLRRLRA